MDIIYYTFVVFLSGILCGLSGALWYLREGKYMGQLVGLSNTCVYVDNEPSSLALKARPL